MAQAADEAALDSNIDVLGTAQQQSSKPSCIKRFSAWGSDLRL